MGKHGTSDHVANRVYAWDVGLIVFVHHDAPVFVKGNSHLGGAETSTVRFAPNSDEHTVRCQLAPLPLVIFDRQRYLPILYDALSDASAQDEGKPLLSQRTLQRRGDLRVGSGNQPGQKFDDGHLSAQP